MVILLQHNGGLNVVLESTFLVVERVCYIHIPLYYSVYEAC